MASLYEAREALEARGHSKSAELFLCHFVPDGSAAGLAAVNEFSLADEAMRRQMYGYERIMVHFVVRRGADSLSLLLPSLYLIADLGCMAGPTQLVLTERHTRNLAADRHIILNVGVGTPVDLSSIILW